MYKIQLIERIIAELTVKRDSLVIGGHIFGGDNIIKHYKLNNKITKHSIA